MVVIASVRLSYSGTNVTTGAWVQLQPVGGDGGSLSGGLTGRSGTSSGPYAMPGECTEFDVFDSSGSTLEMGTGQTSGSVSRVCVIPPGGPAYPIKTQISKGALTWLRAIDQPATGGELVVLFKHGRR